MPPRRVYKVIFHDRDKTYEIYAKSVVDGGLHGFVEVEQILFGEKSALLVDPSEEALRNEFAGVRRVFIPYHSVLRIDEVEKHGTGRIIARGGGDVPPAPFPAGRKS